MTDELKPCPFCNAKNTDVGFVGHAPTCYLIRRWVGGSTKEQLIEAWNTRPVEKYLRDWLEALDSGLTLPAQDEIEKLKARIAELEAMLRLQTENMRDLREIHNEAKKELDVQP